MTVIRLIVISAVALCALQSRAICATARLSGTPYKQLTIGVLLGNPAAREIVARYISRFRRSEIPQQLRRQTLSSIQSVDPHVTRAILAKVYAALARVPATSAVAELSPPPPDGPTNIPNSELDPARHLLPSERESVLHKPLPEQYIWTQDSTANAYLLTPRYFRTTFYIKKLPHHATLYVAGPRQATIYINGREVGHYELNPDLVDIEIVSIGVRVYHRTVTDDLHVGRNVIAIEAVRGPTSDNQAFSTISRHFRDGEVLAVMITPAARGIQARPLLMSNGNWRATAGRAPAGWQRENFGETRWPRVEKLGGIESAIGLFQGNADAGMYAWPGYQGISPFLAQYQLKPLEVRHVFAGDGTLKHVDALTGNAHGHLFMVRLPAARVSREDAPQMILDFGREVTGRLEFISDSDAPAEATVQYGESMAEAILQPFLGVDPVYIPPHGIAYGPKSGFRYALIRFTGGRSTAFRAIRLDGIAYPVRYKGYFVSSSPLLNKLWTIGAYTAHLCMQSDIWDAAKRDRNRWAGDLDVSGRTIEDVFGTKFLMQATLNKLIGPSPVRRHVNGIPGYSALWVNTLYEYYLHSGSIGELERVHLRLVQLLEYMEKDLNSRAEFSDLTHGWPFVDWAPGMDRYDEQTRMATQFEYYQAFRDGAYLLRVLHDETNAHRMASEGQRLKHAAQKYMLDSRGTFGTRWQPNAYAVVSSVATRHEYRSIWRRVLSHVGEAKYDSYVITPYYNFYVVSAMSKMHQRRAALNWVRQYWGGMFDEGATSFWERYSPASLRGFSYQDNLGAGGFQVSLAHGWSSGITPWLMSQIIGIRPKAGGFSRVSIRPDLLGLQWAKGGEPTPHGMLRVSIKKREGYVTKITLPPQETAIVSVPVTSGRRKVLVNGRYVESRSTDDGKRALITLRFQGIYVVKTS